MKLFFIVFLIIIIATLSYVSWHVWHVLPLPRWQRWTVVGILIAAFCTAFLNLGVTDRLPMSLATWCYETGWSMFIVMLYLCIIFLVLDLGRLCHLVPREWLHDNPWTSGAIAVLLTGVLIYGNLNYKHKERVELTYTTGKPLDRDYKIVMLSDLHLGYHNRRAELDRWVEMINAEQPDHVLIAGDIIDMSIRPLTEDHMADGLRDIQAPVTACLGNHEYFSSHPKALRFFKEAGIQLLRDSAMQVGPFTFIGRDDRMYRHRKDLRLLTEGIDSATYTILLDHQPYHLEEAEQCGIDLQLSGHTHEGQVWPISWITHALYECAYGEWQRGSTHYYISSGMGIWGGKFRIGTQSEYVVINIKHSR